MQRRVAKVVVAIVRPPLFLFGFVLGGIYKLLFSRSDRRGALANQQQLERDIRNEVPFLVSREGTRITPDDFGDSPPSFDYAMVDVASPPLTFRFTRGREQLSACVRRQGTEKSGYELSLVLSLLDLTPEIQRGSVNYLSDINRLLSQHWEALVWAFSDARYPELVKQLDDTYAHDRVITKQWETEINRRLYGDK